MSTARPARRTGANGTTAAWTAAETDALRRLYPTAGRAQLQAALPGRSWNATGLQAAGLGLQRRRYWNAPRLAVLAQHYPARGAAYVAQRLGCPAAKVTKQASLRGIGRVHALQAIFIPKPLNAVKLPLRPKSPPPPKPVAEPVAQHQPARLTNLIAQKALQKKKRTAGAARAVSVAYIKSLPYQHPEAHHYRMGGEPAVLQYRAQQRAA